MNCPVCNVTLKVTERQQVEIDYCPQCRGVWLDRGELDKIIERSNTELYGEPGYEEAPPRRPDYPRDRSEGERRWEDRDYGKRRKRGGWLGEIFDFD